MIEVNEEEEYDEEDVDDENEPKRRGRPPSKATLERRMKEMK